MNSPGMSSPDRDSLGSDEVRSPASDTSDMPALKGIHSRPIVLVKWCDFTKVFAKKGAALSSSRAQWRLGISIKISTVSQFKLHK